ncbi:hypothetical protein VTO42DRAFT_8065 [Malbranchea cinnamomea]
MEGLVLASSRQTVLVSTSLYPSFSPYRSPFYFAFFSSLAWLDLPSFVSVLGAAYRTRMEMGAHAFFYHLALLVFLLPSSIDSGSQRSPYFFKLLDAIEVSCTVSFHFIYFNLPVLTTHFLSLLHFLSFINFSIAGVLTQKYPFYYFEFLLLIHASIPDEKTCGIFSHLPVSVLHETQHANERINEENGNLKLEYNHE